MRALVALPRNSRAAELLRRRVHGAHVGQTRPRLAIGRPAASR
jgi:hypothetical protein